MTARAGRQAAAIVAARHNMMPLDAAKTATCTAGLTIHGLAWMAPFDLAPYVNTHFTKINAQTKAALQAWIADGRAHDLPVDALEVLANRI